MFSYDMPEGLTFDDVLLLPAEADFMPRDADVAAQLKTWGFQFVPGKGWWRK